MVLLHPFQTRLQRCAKRIGGAIRFAGSTTSSGLFINTMKLPPEPSPTRFGRHIELLSGSRRAPLPHIRYPQRKIEFISICTSSCFVETRCRKLTRKHPPERNKGQFLIASNNECVGACSFSAGEPVASNYQPMIYYSIKIGNSSSSA